MASSDLSSTPASSPSATPSLSLSSTSLSESLLSSSASMSASSDSAPSSLSSSTTSTPSVPPTSSSVAPPPPSLTPSSSSSPSSTHVSSSTTTSTTPDVTTSSTPSSTPVPETTSSTPLPPPPPPPSSTSFFTPPPTSTSTLPSPVFITTTDLSGQTTTSSPSALTTFLTTTAGDGQPVTVTVVQVNPTLSGPNTGSSGSVNSSFFKNTGAVAGVFLLVGLTATSIILWIIFAIRRRRRTRRLDHDTAVSATLAAVGFHRTPLDDDDDPANASHRSRYGSPEMMHRSSSAFAVNSISSVPSGARTSGYLDLHTPDDSTHQEQYNPYSDYGGGPPSAYTRTATPSSVAVYGHRTSGSAGDVIASHSASGSYEPLLASYYKPNTDQPQTSAPPTPPPRNPRRPSVKNLKEGSQISAPASQSEHGTGTSVDERLDPGLRNRNQSEESDLKDNEDYSRPVLGVRNLPDGVSQTSHQS